MHIHVDRSLPCKLIISNEHYNTFGNQYLIPLKINISHIKISNNKTNSLRWIVYPARTRTRTVRTQRSSVARTRARASARTTVPEKPSRTRTPEPELATIRRSPSTLIGSWSKKF